MKFYEFIEKRPAIGRLVVIEGTERVLAEEAVSVVLDRVLPDGRDLNLERFQASALDSMARVADALGAMPFLAERRVVVVEDAQMMKTPMRRELWQVAESAPDGNVLVLVDLLSPRSQRPQSFGALAGRSALRIDTTATADVRARFVHATLERLGATAEPRAVTALAESDADLAAVRNDLQKLALGGKPIRYADLEQESLSVEDPKAYHYAGALLEGRTAEALAIAQELLASDRNAAIPLLSAVATECAFVWELARPGGELPARAKWRERALRPIASRIGERRARLAFERATLGFESIVTGRIEDPKLAVDLVSAEVSSLARPTRKR